MPFLAGFFFSVPLFGKEEKFISYGNLEEIRNNQNPKPLEYIYTLSSLDCSSFNSLKSSPFRLASRDSINQSVPDTRS